MISNIAYECPGIHIRYCKKIVPVQKFEKAGIRYGTGIVVAKIFTDKAGDLNGIGFHFLFLGTVIAYMGIGSYHYLAEIGRIRKYFLITGHSGIETYFAESGSFTVPNGFTVENSTVRK